MKKTNIYIAASALLLGLILVYSNHFQNSFHFDDDHTVRNNLYIRNVSNIPLFFKDAATFSSLPPNQSYRPVVTTTLALDYWLGRGLNPFYFHLSTFILFLIQGLLMFVLFKKIFSVSSENKNVEGISLFAVAWYLVHPANAETINYVIARSDSLSTWFVLLAFVMYVASPFCRKYFLYLIPVIIGALAKIPTILFAPLLLIYIILFEKKLAALEVFKPENIRQSLSAITESLPAFIVCGLLYYLVRQMEPNWNPGALTSRYSYFITQPYVIFHYCKTLLFPFWLSADTDWVVFDSILNPKAIFGFLFCGALFLVAVLISGNPKMRPISFGIFWFFIALVPTSSIIPLSEVMNDHRIFFPYAGLAPALVWSLVLLMQTIKIPVAVSGIFCVILLFAYGYGTHERNEVWKTDESLWKDVTEKSPANPRGLMNYGLVLMARADYAGAEDHFTRALKIWPYYAYLYTNMGVLKGATHRPREAEQYFLKAIAYRPEVPSGYYFYGRFLHQQNRNN
ncbi:MAG: tetratricopeptide repeat protein, partial [Methylococcales bacterium]